MIEQRPFGSSGDRMSAIGLGTVNFSRVLDESSAHRLMDYAVERGITFFDTAEEYSKGQSERIIGSWMRANGSRKLITLCTKVLGGAGNIHAALEASLDRLGTDYVDIYLMHEFVSSPPPEEILAALTAEVRAGRARSIGCSNYTPEQLEQALKISDSRGYARFEVLEPEYNLVMAPAGVDATFPVGLSEVEDGLLPMAQRERIAVTTYSPLGAGFLTGKYTRQQPPAPGSRFDKSASSATHFLTDRNFKILELLRSRAQRLGVPVIRLALAWVMAHPAVTSVIIGPRTTEQIDDAIAAREMALDPELRAEITRSVRAL